VKDKKKKIVLSLVSRFVMSLNNFTIKHYTIEVVMSCLSFLMDQTHL